MDLDMGANHTKTAFLFEQVRRALQNGRYAPGQRIDPGHLATEFKISPTPVRAALNQLVGHRLLVDQARGGLQVPLPTEIALHDLYEWMEHLLLWACEISHVEPARGRKGPEPGTEDADVVKLTWQLFDGIARAADQRLLYESVRNANDRLAPIRRAKIDLIEDSLAEYLELAELWHRRHIPALQDALRKYHTRRKQLVPRIVASLTDRLRGRY